MIFTTGLATGMIMSVILIALIFGSLAYNPRLWVNDAPREMQEAIPPLSKKEKRDRTLLAIPIFAAALVTPLVVLFWYESTQQAVTFLDRFFLLWIAMMTFNIIDLVFVDWVVVVWWQPSWTTLPGVEHLYHLNSYGFHFRAFLKGTVGITLVSLVVAGMTSLIL